MGLAKRDLQTSLSPRFSSSPYSSCQASPTKNKHLIKLEKLSILKDKHFIKLEKLLAPKNRYLIKFEKLSVPRTCFVFYFSFCNILLFWTCSTLCKTFFILMKMLFLFSILCLYALLECEWISPKSLSQENSFSWMTLPFEFSQISNLPIIKFVQVSYWPGGLSMQLKCEPLNIGRWAPTIVLGIFSFNYRKLVIARTSWCFFFWMTKY